MMKCRACFKDCEPVKLVEIFDGQSSIAEILADVARINVSATEDFPRHICAPCCNHLENAQKFILLVQETDRLMRNALQKPSPKSSNNQNLDDSIDDKINEGISVTCDPLALENSTTCVSGLQNNDLSNIQIAETESLSATCKNSRENSCMNSSSITLCHHVPTVPADNDLESLKEVKQEPEDYDEYSIGYEYNECLIPDIEIKEEDVPTADHIKVEPLSEDAALMYHQQTEGPDEPPSLLNGYHEEHFYENEFKPTEEELTNFAMDYQMNAGKKKLKPFGCSYCEKTFSSRQYLLSHEQKHLAKKFREKCLLCNKIFISEKKLKHHVITSHSYGEPTDCIEEDLNEESESELELEKLICDKCPTLKFSSLWKFKKHSRIHKPSRKVYNQMIMCITCNRPFVNKAAILSHFRHFHGQTTLIKTEKLDNDEYDQSKSPINRHELKKQRKSRILDRNNIFQKKYKERMKKIENGETSYKNDEKKIDKASRKTRKTKVSRVW